MDDDATSFGADRGLGPAAIAITTNASAAEKSTMRGRSPGGHAAAQAREIVDDLHALGRLDLEALLELAPSVARSRSPRRFQSIGTRKVEFFPFRSGVNFEARCPGAGRHRGLRGRNRSRRA